MGVYTSIVAPEDQAQKDSYKLFTTCTGAKVTYEGSKEFEAQLPVRVQAGNPPDIAYVPQPGLLKTLVATGKVVEAPSQVADNVDEFFGEDWKAYGSVDDKFYAAPLGANVKSFVWYSPKMFADNGWQIPETWDDMIALSDTIAATGIKPWCAGIESGEATGWPATDWLEDVLLRTAGPDVYDQWVSHDIPFNDPQVATALDDVGGILKNDKYVNGGIGDVKSIATTAFQDAGLPILDGKCAMHRQAGFYAANWPEGTKVAEDGDVFAFYLPTMSDDFGKPVLGGGEFVTAFSDDAGGAGPPDLPVDRRVGQREGQGHARRWLGERQQGSSGGEPGQPDRPALRPDPPGPGRGVPLRRLGPDAGRSGCQLLLEGDDRLDHRSEHLGHPRPHREFLAVVLTDA